RELSSGKVYYYANTTGSSYGSRTQVGTGFKGVSTFTLDYDADGRMDLVARTKTGTGQLKLYRSNGSGRFISEPRKVIRTSGWNKMIHLSSITNHLGDGGQGILARESSGNLRYFKVTRNKVHAGAYIGRGGWETLRLGS
ncbi:VCBS repeat-containing protein, partial [Arthrobacter deserti]|nr:VCBS repeat-containing protein [Arthrobacter deserti]